MHVMQPNPDEVRRIILNALAEDIGHGDVTSNSTIPESLETTLQFIPREPLVVAGIEVIGSVFETLDSQVDYQPRVLDGQAIEAGQVMASVMGNARALLAGERVALNLLARMCGIATETARYVKAIEGTGAVILDTRKTMPCLRELDKFAVRCGGGKNHRMRLDDAVLIKDNHIAAVGSVAQAVARAKAANPATMQIEVECDTLTQVREALEAGADMLLLDNMSLDDLRGSVTLAKGKARCEASGNMTLDSVRDVALTGVDFISVGRITHSVRNVDIGLDAVG
jgi:nicotinate-nucleotide pyrophosphorylase (carboxylating)